VRVDHGEVEGCNVKIRVSDSQEHGAVDNRVVSITVNRSIRLEGVTSVVASQSDGCVCSVELRNPHGVPVSTVGRSGSDVGVVGSDSKTGSLPLEKNLLACETEGLAAVARDGGLAAVADDVGVEARLVSGDGGDSGVSDAAASHLEVGGVVGREPVGVCVVHDVERGEVLPCEAGGVGRTAGDVGSEVCP